MPVNKVPENLAIVQHYMKQAMPDISPVLRQQSWDILGMFASKMRRCGRWCIARHMAKRGFPVEMALAAIYFNNYRG